MQANKTADNQYLIPLIDGTIENIDITDGILLTTSEFVSQEDIEMTTTHDDLSLFQISFCIDGNMEWSYINNEVVHQFQIAAQQSQVRYGTFKECRSRISGKQEIQRHQHYFGWKNLWADFHLYQNKGGIIWYKKNSARKSIRLHTKHQ